MGVMPSWRSEGDSSRSYSSLMVFIVLGLEKFSTYKVFNSFQVWVGITKTECEQADHNYVFDRYFILYHSVTRSICLSSTMTATARSNTFIYFHRVMYLEA
jgi:hypothetical protein